MYFFNNRVVIAAFFIVLWAAGLWSAAPLYRRWREERADRRVALAAEWNDVRDFNARRGVSPAQLMAELRQQGLSALVVSPSTLEDLTLRGRVVAEGQRLRVNDRALARQMWEQWSWRGVTGVQWNSQGDSTFFSHPGGHFYALQSLEMGYDPTLLQQAATAGLQPILRVYDDPWLTANRFQEWLAQLPAAAGLLFSSEEMPGRTAGQAFWARWIRRQGIVHILPEFHPTLASRKLARALPAQTFRVHSIPAAENVPPDKQAARWRRALVERSCRVLLVRMAPSDTWSAFLAQIARLSDMIRGSGLTVSFPRPRAQAWFPSQAQRTLSPWIALAMVCLTPAFALLWGLQVFPRAGWSFGRVALLSLAGGLIVAAVADNPYTRLAVTPFRGVKAGLLISWSLPLLILYQPWELRDFLRRTLTRRDVLISALAAVIFGYLILRTGNASPGWKPAWEQSARDGLEALLVARPRFKEWAIGWPLLWAGFWLQRLFQERRDVWDARPLIAAGMIGPISMINTFCHLHSPLWVEILRSFNGLVLGALGGALLAWVLSRWIPARSSAAPILSSKVKALTPSRSIV